MRKFIVYVIAVGIMSLVMHTQYVYANQFGIKGGANFANIYNTEEIDLNLDTKNGFIIGGFFKFNLNNQFAIQPEIFFSMKGTKTSFEDTYSYNDYGYSFTATERYDYSIKLNYLEIPVLLKYKVPVSGKIKPSLFVGPYMAFKLSAKWVGTMKYESTQAFDGEVYNESYEENFNEDLDEIERTDFGITIGGGMDIKIGGASIIIDVRYNLGLSGLSKFAETWEEGVKNKAFTLMLGVAF